MTAVYENETFRVATTLAALLTALGAALQWSGVA